MKRVKVRVPASTTNMGPGFDALGMALTLYNDFEFERTNGTTTEIQVKGRDALVFEDGIRKLILRTMRVFSHAARFSHRGIHVRMISRVPIARGLGSSATVIVGTLVGMNALAGKRLSEGRLLECACLIEGHPDNVAAAFKGGLVASSFRKGKVSCVALSPARQLKVWVASPDHLIFTKAARTLLPKRVNFKDAVSNVGHTALLVAALVKGEFSLLPVAMCDRLHQPYRQRLIPGARSGLTAFKKIKDCGASLSGSGPSMLVLGGPHVSSRRVRQTFMRIYRSAKKDFQFFPLKVDRKGAIVK